MGRPLPEDPSASDGFQPSFSAYIEIIGVIVVMMAAINSKVYLKKSKQFRVALVLFAITFAIGLVAIRYPSIHLAEYVAFNTVFNSIMVLVVVFLVMVCVRPLTPGNALVLDSIAIDFSALPLREQGEGTSSDCEEPLLTGTDPRVLLSESVGVGTSSYREEHLLTGTDPRASIFELNHDGLRNLLLQQMQRKMIFPHVNWQLVKLRPDIPEQRSLAQRWRQWLKHSGSEKTKERGDSWVDLLLPRIFDKLE